MKKPLLFILIFFGALSLHAQTHQHYKDTIDVVMESDFTQPDPADRYIPCDGISCFTFGLGEAFPSTFAPFSYQWQKSEDSVTWANVLGATIADPTLYVTGGKTYFRRIATCACGSIISKSALVIFDRPPLPKFMAYNLGADSTITDPKDQMRYLANQTNQSDATVFGGFYQWGRKNLPYAVNSGVTPPLRSPFTTIVWTSSMTYDSDGQIEGQDAKHVCDRDHLNNYNWSGSQNDSLWGNGKAIEVETPGGGVLYTDGKYYQDPNYVMPQNDPCPTGYRIPTQNDWELMVNYDCNPTASTSDFPISATAKPDNNCGLTWVKVSCDGGDCTVSNQTSWTLLGPPWYGYAIYETPIWETSPVALGGSLIAPTAPRPIMFLPAPGVRMYNCGMNALSGHGHYWSSSINGISATSLYIRSSGIILNSIYNRASGLSVRCVKCGAEPCP